MRRQLTVRERALLVVLGIVAVIGAYLSWVYTPMVNERDRCNAEVLALQDQIDIMQMQVEKQEQMKRELDRIFEMDPDPLSLPDYDNAQPMMRKLHSVLASAPSYSLAFGSTDSSEAVVRRNVSMTFTAEDYASAKRILTQLNNSEYRCMLDSLNLNLDQRDGNVSVSGTIVFFEYQSKDGIKQG